MPQTLTDANFRDAVLRSKLPVLVDFYAPWCGPCKQLVPVLDAIETAYAGQLVVGKLDVDAEPKTADAYHVASIPYLAVFSGGKQVAAVEGAVPRKVLLAMIDKVLATKATPAARTKKPTAVKKSTAATRKKAK